MNSDILWNPNELYHHGIKGQKWGVRRYQNYDGSLTSAGKLRYGSISVRRDKNHNGYYLHDDDYGNEAHITEKEWRKANRITKEYIDDALRKSYGIRLSDVEKYIKRDGAYINKKYGIAISSKDMKKIFDSAMETTLQDAIAYSYEKQRIEKMEKLSSSEFTTKYGVKPPKNGIRYSSDEQHETFNEVYKILEKENPDFDSLPEDVQSIMFFNYLNDSGLYQYI